MSSKGASTSSKIQKGAGFNLTNAQNQRTIAKYQAKLAELQLIQITGQLLNVNL